MKPARRVLVIEDGTEYVDAFRRLAPAGSAELVRAADADEARRVLGQGGIDAVFLDVVFDRTPPENLCGESPELRARFAGDPARLREHLARQQGFYLARALAPELPARVVIAWDFSDEPGRLQALRESVPELEGVPEGAPLSRVLARLTG